MDGSSNRRVAPQVAQLLLELATRMDQYVACVREVPRAEKRLKRDLLRLLARRHDEVEALHARVEQVVAQLSQGAITPPLEAILRCISGGSAGEMIEASRARVAVLEDPKLRCRAEEWLVRAGKYANAGRRAQTVACIASALLPLLEEPGVRSNAAPCRR